MFNAFFGNYLLNKGIVTPAQLSGVLENQKQIRLKLGVLAVNSNFMTYNQVNEIHNLQQKHDRRFGDLAIEKGYLTEEILMTLLAQQKSEHLLLAQALIDDGIMTYESFEKEINAYKLDNELSDEEFEALKDGNVDVIIHAFTNFENPTEAKLYSEFLSLFIKNLIRFVDSNIRLDRLVRIPYESYTNLFQQRLIGDKTIFTAFSGDLSAILTIAGKHAEEDFAELDDYAIDSAGEFLNLSNGLFVVNKSNDGIKLKLSVQEYSPSKILEPAGNLYMIPIYISSGVINLLIGTV